MATVHKQFSEHFLKWESRGRGWNVFKTSVHPEPPFRPFLGHYPPPTLLIDDGRKPTFLSSLLRKLNPAAEAPPVIPEPEEEPAPPPLVRESLLEIQTSLPADFAISKEAFDQFLGNLSLAREPVALELIGTPNCVRLQFTADPNDASLVRRQLQAYFPHVVFQQAQNTLPNAWYDTQGDEALIVEFGLAREFMFPLACPKLDPFIGIVGELAHLQPGEIALFQVIFHSANAPWPASIMRAVSDRDGSAFFVNVPDLFKSAEAKVSRPLYAVVVRIGVKSESYERTLEIARGLSGSLRSFANPRGNELIPLTNVEYPYGEHVEDLLLRQSRRSGMLLNADELIGFVHLPSPAVTSPALQRQMGKTKRAPGIVSKTLGVLIGENEHAGAVVPISLSPEQRVRHAHIIGASGTGKSTLLFNLIRQDIENGEGVALLDPHGDLVERVLTVIPPHRIEDVILLDPSDIDFPVGFNILSGHSDYEKNLIASDLVSVFQRLSTSWGDQMASVLRNAILAFLENTRSGTLADLRRFLVEPAFRADWLKTVQDSEVVYYWQKGFPLLSGNKSLGPVITRLETFLSRKQIRYMVAQQENRLNFANMMDTGKIFLAKLSQGLLGHENSYLLGTLLVSKFHQLAMARQAQRISARRDFWLYIDEFHNFITPSMAEILTGARKYRVGLILAHQELRQLQRDSEVASAVMSNPYTRIVFRVGDDDARRLSDGFAYFEAPDLQNLETGQAIARIERSDFDFNLSVPLPSDPDEAQARERREKVITASRKMYGTPRAEFEAAQAKQQASEAQEVKTREPKARATKPEPAPESRDGTTQENKVSPSEAKQVPSVAQRPAEPQDHSASLESTVSERKVSFVPADLGRGGAQHQTLQNRIKQAAERLGFRSIIEKQILDGQGSVDLLLERPDITFACEISISTTIDHEVGNVTKCLKAGFNKVAVICLNEERLRKIAAAVSGSLGVDGTATVNYYTPDQFIVSLPPLPPAADIPEPLRTRRGYKIKHTLPMLTQEEQKQKEEAAIRSIAEAMRKRPKSGE